jgi:fimbrial chaperone protein
MMRRRCFIPALAGLLAPQMSRGQAAGAARLDITPIGLNLGGVGESADCTVDNFGGTAADAQLRVKAWRQTGGRDMLEDTVDVGASPPFMTVSPGGQQIVRLVNLAAAPGQAELAFRVLLNQVPTAGQDSGPGVHIEMAFSVPLFIPGTNSAPPQLQAGFVASPAGVVLRVVNQGDVHARLVDLTVRDVSGRPLFAAPGLAGYALARSTRDFPTHLRDMPASSGTLTVTTQTTKTPLAIPLLTGL